MVSEWELLLRLTLSCILGGVIGYERQSRRKSAGLRTNVLVCLGSCLIMVLSEAIYQQVEGLTNADPARLAAQVVSGIGFLGAGAIMKEGLTVTGLTTAACLWVVAGVGLAVGAGFYSGALFTSALVFGTLGTLSRLDDWVTHEKNLAIMIQTIDAPGQLVHISECLEDLQLKIRSIKAKNDTEDTMIIDLFIYNHNGLKTIFIVQALKQLEGIISVDVE
ncbi:putative Mg2+ transporter-C (MgtC) family protein [Propionispira arboris]|uniref:Putative Mg2+ transporter-C (MgtC) family protein n=1 Tax=Propionispira arboris TaxID=84035 RepID=A0A1H7B4L0_9FIRM|nr:MgtC/SapB family protein [Propionispira arboris]SEJ72669.1 putative Mg2+ transporter-C (MgtC) family protein [Propionispira arboris]